MADTSVTQYDRINVDVLRLLEPIVPSFLHDTTGNVNRIKSALEINDFSTIESIAHSLKGTGKSYGFDAVSEISEDIQKAAQVRDRQRAQRLIADLSNYLDNIEIVYV